MTRRNGHASRCRCAVDNFSVAWLTLKPVASRSAFSIGPKLLAKGRSRMGPRLQVGKNIPKAHSCPRLL